MGRRPDPFKKQHIIQTAVKVFAQKGYAGTRIIEIAEAAGIGKGTVYEYFPSKEDLFFGVFQYIMQKPIDQLLSAPPGEDGSAADRIQGVVDSMIEFWLSQLDHYSLVMEFWSAATTLPSRKRFKEAFRQAYADLRRTAAGFIRQGIDSGEFQNQVDPEKIAAAMVGAFDYLMLQAWLDPAFDARDVSQVFLGIMLKGMQCQVPQLSNI